MKAKSLSPVFAGLRLFADRFEDIHLAKKTDESGLPQIVRGK